MVLDRGVIAPMPASKYGSENAIRSARSGVQVSAVISTSTRLAVSAATMPLKSIFSQATFTPMRRVISSAMSTS